MNGWVDIWAVDLISRCSSSSGATINARDEVGRTALWYAVSQDGNVEALQMLLNYGADVNVGDERDLRTPLHVSRDGDL